MQQTCCNIAVYPLFANFKVQSVFIFDLHLQFIFYATMLMNIQRKKLYILQYTANMQHTCSIVALYYFIIIFTNLMVGNVFSTSFELPVQISWKSYYIVTKNYICCKYAANMQQHCCIALYCKFYSRKCFLFLICTFSPNFKQIG